MAVTVDLGDLKGVWKPYYQRRLKLHEDTEKILLGLWHSRRPDFGSAVGNARSAAGLRVYETVAPPDPGTVAALLAAVQEVVNDPEVVAALSVQLAKAEAEGRTDALALAAHEAGAVGFDFDLAFESATAALRDLESINAAAVSTLKSVGASTVNDLAKVLADLIEKNAGYDAMVSALDASFTDAKALSYWVDVATSAALSQGALDLYTSEGVAQANWVTAGDARVCAACEANEEGDPWDIVSMPVPPQHGRCRCTVTANDSIPAAVWQQFESDNPGASFDG